MSLIAAYIVKRSDAIDMLKIKNVNFYSNDCNERLADLLYENSEDGLVSYEVVNDDYQKQPGEQFKYTW